MKKKHQRPVFWASAALLATAALVGCNDQGYKVTGDNKKEITQYQEQRGDAIAYLLKTTVYVGEIRGLAALPVGPELVAKSKKMLALKSEGDAFGMLSPLSQCRGIGYKAQEYWLTVAGTIRTQTPEDALNAYVKEAQGCQEQIDTAPAAVTYIETSLGKNPPVDGCLKVISLGEEEKVQNWSCPAQLLSKQ
ncbi:hypothetical protein [Pseudomonas sp. RIT623]|uniref:hypothetical protein n=1 Tax=Pseudomonas sp. RIT623 TaxID=2559075 RepID=UPI00106F6DCB|nr:hypothetical protein [Pseudomonas sp. RIT623]TFF38649.1 hypothetical protein E3U47_15555 [Pseudomonas sp. RIT623]